MKKNLSLLILSATIFIFNSDLQAQINKGTSLLGGSIYFTSQKITQYAPGENKQSNYGLNPSYGRAIRQNLVIGGDVFYNGQSNKAGNPSAPMTYKQHNYGLGVYVRQYRNLGQSGFYLFLQSRLGAGISTGKSKSHPTNSSADTKLNGFNARLNLHPGIAYAITPKFHIETGLDNLFYVDYSNNKTKEVATSQVVQKSSAFSAGASLGQNTQWSVGFRFLFGS